MSLREDLRQVVDVTTEVHSLGTETPKYQQQDNPERRLDPPQIRDHTFSQSQRRPS